MRDIPCMYHPDKDCKPEDCRLYEMNLLGIINGTMSMAEIEIVISELKQQPKIQARVLELIHEKIDALITQSCGQQPKH